MMAMHILLASSALLCLLVLKWNTQRNFILPSRVLLRFTQVLFLFSLVLPLALEYLPQHHRPTLPARFTFPLEEVEGALSKPLSSYSLKSQAASTMDSLQSGVAGQGKSDPMHMMMGLMLGKNLLAADYRKKENKIPIAVPELNKNCLSCGHMNARDNSFCPKCGKGV